MSAINTFFELHNLDPIAEDILHLTAARPGMVLIQRRLEAAPLRVPLSAVVAYIFERAELIVSAPIPEHQYNFRALMASVVNFMFFAKGLTDVFCRSWRPPQRPEPTESVRGFNEGRYPQKKARRAGRAGSPATSSCIVEERQASSTLSRMGPLEESGWSDKPRNRRKWAKLQLTTGFLQAQLALHGDRFCHYCGRTGLKLYSWQESTFVRHYDKGDMATADHVVALANGGSNSTSNLVVACQPCNYRKGAS
eukprot:jgi/Tetstr1/466308/TSEL_010841.t1